MWANLTTYDGPVPADGTYFFQYMQIEQPIKPGTYESFSCWAQFNRETSYVPENEITVVNYYGTQRFSAGNVDVDGRIMEFINAETRVPGVSD